MDRLSNEHIPDTRCPPKHPSRGRSKSPLFKLRPNGWTMTTMLTEHFILTACWAVVKWRNEQSHSFRQSPTCVNADRAEYVRLSCGLITTVVTTLYGIRNGTFASFTETGCSGSEALTRLMMSSIFLSASIHAVTRRIFTLTITARKAYKLWDQGRRCTGRIFFFKPTNTIRIHCLFRLTF